ncbi:hypothetical protein BH09ACT9_BH09ACT9_00880 [soil metagenome]
MTITEADLPSIVATARKNLGMTAAEFDRELATGASSTKASYDSPRGEICNEIYWRATLPLRDAQGGLTVSVDEAKKVGFGAVKALHDAIGRLEQDALARRNGRA